MPWRGARRGTVEREDDLDRLLVLDCSDPEPAPLTRWRSTRPASREWVAARARTLRSRSSSMSVGLFCVAIAISWPHLRHPSFTGWAVTAAQWGSGRLGCGVVLGAFGGGGPAERGADLLPRSIAAGGGDARRRVEVEREPLGHATSRAARLRAPSRRAAEPRAACATPTALTADSSGPQRSSCNVPPLACAGRPCRSRCATRHHTPHSTSCS
jgi:hypothetical protein